MSTVYLVPLYDVISRGGRRLSGVCRLLRLAQAEEQHGHDCVERQGEGGQLELAEDVAEATADRNAARTETGAELLTFWSPADGLLITQITPRGQGLRRTWQAIRTG